MAGRIVPYNRTMRKLLAIYGVIALLAAASLVYVVLLVRSFTRADKIVAAVIRSTAVPIVRAPLPGPNAADLYKKAGAGLADLTQEQSLALAQAAAVPWSDPDGRWDRLLLAQASSLQLAKAGAGLADCDFLPASVLEIRVETSKPETQIWGSLTNLGRLLLLDARRAESRGDTAAAVEDYIAVLGMTRHAAQQPYLRMLYLATESTFLDEVFAPLRDLLRTGALSSEQLGRLAAALDGVRKADEGIGAATREYRRLADSLEIGAVEAELRPARLLLGGRYGRALEEVRAARSQYTEQLASTADANDSAAYQARISAVASGHFNMQPIRVWFLRCLRLSSGTGDCLLANPAVLTKDWPATRVVDYHLSRARLEVLMAAAAIRLFQSRHGGNPASLDAAFQDCGVKPARDPFSGFGPLKYSAGSNDWTVYSAGRGEEIVAQGWAPGKTRGPKAAPGPRAGKTGIRWVGIPGGKFTMSTLDWFDARKRYDHEVAVKAFEMSKTLVTVAQYKACVDARVCTAPLTVPYCNWGVPGRGNNPVNCVDWEQASDFARWAGGRLPTEAEWEYAARSGGKKRKYPWGDEDATCDKAVMYGNGGYGCGGNSTMPVCSKPAGNTQQGLCDMAGNVNQWVQDKFERSYAGAPTDGSAFEGTGPGRVVRGAPFSDKTVRNLQTDYRIWTGPESRTPFQGFRVARSIR